MLRTDRKQREFERREEEILDAALALFSNPNWESVTVEQIAKSADVGKGTVYKHVVSKDELLFKLLMRFYRGLLIELQQVSNDESDFLQQFKRIFEYGLRYHLERSEYKYIVEYCNRIDFKERADDAWHSSFLELDQAFSGWAEPMILQAMAQDLIEARPLKQVEVGIHACFDGAVAMLWAGKDWCSHGSEDDIIESVTAFMMAGLVGQKSTELGR